MVTTESLSFVNDCCADCFCPKSSSELKDFDASLSSLSCCVDVVVVDVVVVVVDDDDDDEVITSAVNDPKLTDLTKHRTNVPLLVLLLLLLLLLFLFPSPPPPMPAECARVCEIVGVFSNAVTPGRTLSHPKDRATRDE